MKHGWKWLVPENDWQEHKKPNGTVEVKHEQEENNERHNDIAVGVPEL